MPATLRFMLASRRSELLGLEDLTRTCELVTRISQLVHALQKERGYSNIYLGGNAAHQRQQLDALSLEAEALERAVRQDLDRIDLEAVSAADKTRLFTRIAYALHSLDELPALRRRIREHAISMQDATATLVRLIGGLLAVVFEAADTASDPHITRCLVALFNFMQGKELAGQERALGVVGFASGYFRADMLERLEHLLEGQERCFDTFSRFASPAAQALWQALCASDTNINACRLRDIARRTNPGAAVEAQLGELWFELHTGRIDAMKHVETRLEQDLLQQCRQSIERIRKDLQSHRKLLDGIADSKNFFESNAQFHELLAAASGNAYILQAVQQQNRLRRLTEFHSVNNVERVKVSCREHLAILDALEQGDNEWASTLLHRHLEVASKMGVARSKA